MQYTLITSKSLSISEAVECRNAIPHYKSQEAETQGPFSGRVYHGGDSIMQTQAELRSKIELILYTSFAYPREAQNEAVDEVLPTPHIHPSLP
jgi:hypothetical protein